jgi:hypothetical protein
MLVVRHCSSAVRRQRWMKWAPTHFFLPNYELRTTHHDNL